MKKVLMGLLVLPFVLSGITYGISEDQIFIFGESIGDALIKKIDKGEFTFEKAQTLIEGGISSYMNKLSKPNPDLEIMNNMMAFSVINNKLRAKKNAEIEEESEKGTPISYTTSELVFHQDNLVGTDGKANILVAGKGEVLVTLRYKHEGRVSCPMLYNAKRDMIGTEGIFYYINDEEHWYSNGLAPKTDNPISFCVYAVSEEDLNSEEGLIISYSPLEEELATAPRLNDLQRYEWSDAKLDTEVYKLASLGDCINSLVRDSTRDIKFNYCEERDALINKIIEEEKEELTREVTLEDKNALRTAESYLRYSTFSKEGLRGQLEYEGYTTSAINYALRNVEVDYNEQCLGEAISYLKYSAFSKKGLMEQLEYEGYTSSEIDYAMSKLDW